MTFFTRGGKREQMEKNAATNSHLSESHLVPPVTRQIQIQLQIQKKIQIERAVIASHLVLQILVLQRICCFYTSVHSTPLSYKRSGSKQGLMGFYHYSFDLKV